MGLDARVDVDECGICGIGIYELKEDHMMFIRYVNESTIPLFAGPFDTKQAAQQYNDVAQYPNASIISADDLDLQEFAETVRIALSPQEVPDFDITKAQEHPRLQQVIASFFNDA